MYAAGIPVGLFVDHRGPRPGVLFGAFTMGGGYFFLQRGEDMRGDCAFPPAIVLTAHQDTLAERDL